MAAAKKMNWGTGIVAVIILFFGGMGVMVSIAMRNGSDLVAENYYERELAYQERIDSRRRAADAGDALKIVWSADTLVFTLSPDAVSAGLKGTIHFYRPSDRRQDREVPMDLDAGHSQRIATKTMARGLWRVQAGWVAKGAEYYAERPVVLN